RTAGPAAELRYSAWRIAVVAKSEQRFVSRLTALLAAADSARCPVPSEGIALTRTGRRRGQSLPPAPPSAQAGPWLPRAKRATPDAGARPGAAGLRTRSSARDATTRPGRTSRCRRPARRHVRRDRPRRLWARRRLNSGVSR